MYIGIELHTLFNTGGMILYTVFDVAKWFLTHIDREAGDSITHLKLQKLVYYAQAWSLVLNKEPLFDNEIEAWSHGPVVPELYREYKSYRWNALPYPEGDFPSFDEESESVLKEVQEVYGEHSGKVLEKLTHTEQPWIYARLGYAPEERCSTPISHESMVKYYSSLLEN